MCGFILGLRGMVVITGWWMERIGLILFRGLLYFPAPPPSREMQSNIFKCSAEPFIYTSWCPEQFEN